MYDVMNIYICVRTCVHMRTRVCMCEGVCVYISHKYTFSILSAARLQRIKSVVIPGLIVRDEWDTRGFEASGAIIKLTLI